MTRGWSDAEKKVYAERMRLGKQLARDRRAAMPAPAHVEEDDYRPARAAAAPDPSRWVQSGRSHLITRIDPETGEIIAQGYFENRVENGIVVTDWVPA